MLPTLRSTTDPVGPFGPLPAPVRRLGMGVHLLGFCLLFLVHLTHAGSTGVDPEVLVLPSPTNDVRLRMFLGTGPGALHTFNSFEISAWGQVLLPASPGPAAFGEPDWKVCGKSLQAVLLDGNGPTTQPGFPATVIHDVSGSGWRCVGLDLSGAYADAKVQYRRNLLYVVPDLFVVHDHIDGVGGRRLDWQWHLPPGARVDPAWGDIRIGTTNAGVVIHAPGTSREPRVIRRMSSPVDGLPAGTMTAGLAMTNHLGSSDLVVVYGVQRSGVPADFAFKWVESNTAVGARIYRDGLPTLVGFRTTSAPGKASITGFEFDGPLGVSVLRPKSKPIAK